MSKSLEPSTAEDYYYRGLAFYEKEDYEKAINDLEKAANLYQQQGNQEKLRQTQKMIGEIRANHN